MNAALAAWLTAVGFTACPPVGRFGQTWERGDTRIQTEDDEGFCTIWQFEPGRLGEMLAWSASFENAPLAAITATVGAAAATWGGDPR